MAVSLSALLETLADPHRVFTRCGENTDVDITEHIHEVSLVAREAWRNSMPPGAQGPSAADIRVALRRVDAETAVHRMADLATTDLVWGDVFREPKVAGEAARQVVSLLGNDSVWWSNGGDMDGSWHPVTGCTFDGVIAGVGATHFVVVLQAGED